MDYNQPPALTLEPGDEPVFHPHAVQVVAQFKAMDDDISEADSAALAANMLREKFRAVGYQMVTDPVAGDPQPVTLNASRDGWREFEPGLGTFDGHVIEWTATGEPGATDPAPTEGFMHADGVYIVAVPDEINRSGGSLRIRHGFGKPVTVKAWADPEATVGIGYHFTQPVSADEEHIELVPGTVVLNVFPDPEPAEA